MTALDKYLTNVGTSNIFKFITEVYQEALKLTS